MLALLVLFIVSQIFDVPRSIDFSTVDSNLAANLSVAPLTALSNAAATRSVPVSLTIAYADFSIADMIFGVSLLGE